MTNLAGLISYKETKAPTIIEPSNIIFVIGYNEPMKFSIYIIKLILKYYLKDSYNEVIYYIFLICVMILFK